MDLANDPRALVDHLFDSVQPEVKALMAAEIPNVIPPTLFERFVSVIERHVGPLSPTKPLTAAAIQQQCRFCYGRGCLACDAAKDAEFKRRFPNGPELLAVFQLNDPEDMQLARVALSPATLGQKNIDAVFDSLRAIAKRQKRLHAADREDIP